MQFDSADSIDPLAAPNRSRNIDTSPEAELAHRRALEKCEREFGPENIETLFPLADLALLLRAKGEYAEAESLAQRALETSRKVLPEGSRSRPFFEHLLAFIQQTHRCALAMAQWEKEDKPAPKPARKRK